MMQWQLVRHSFPSVLVAPHGISPPNLPTAQPHPLLSLFHLSHHPHPSYSSPTPLTHRGMDPLTTLLWHLMLPLPAPGLPVGT